MSWSAASKDSKPRESSMYQLNDTIVAVSSPTFSQAVIVRISGPRTIESLNEIFSPPCRSQGEAGPPFTTEGRAIVSGSIRIGAGPQTDARLYLFFAPRSYTGQDVAELHLFTNRSVTEALMGDLLGKGLRMAGPGEFTARAYLNGKMDLSQAEAVNEIIVSSNKFQLEASHRLLAGRLAQTTAKIAEQLMDCLSLIEAGLDFSGQDIQFLTAEQAVERLTEMRNELERLKSGSISYEQVVDLPSVGIAGAPNAGKSTLLNTLLGQPRSIVSDIRKTTRDVLSGVLNLPHCRCVLFDCAGLAPEPADILDELAREAATEALRNSSVVLFCVDLSKPDYSEDSAVRRLIEPKALLPVATKSDLLSQDALEQRLCRLNSLFGTDFLQTSAKTSASIETLRAAIDGKLVELGLGHPGPLGRGVSTEAHDAVALTARHRRAVLDAVDNINEAVSQLEAGSEEIAAMTLRAAQQALSEIEQQQLDEQLLHRIFGRFCIGK